MPKNEKQKQKLIRVLEILMRSTDSENGVTVSEIISALGEYGISAERKSIYDDFFTLGEIGFEVSTLLLLKVLRLFPDSENAHKRPTNPYFTVGVCHTYKIRGNFH